MASNQAIGMMEGAYFVGRVELLNWLNDLLKLDYTKVEQTCSAAAFCQIMDVIYPGQIPLSKVNFSAKHEYEFIKNFKVLQVAFDKFNIDKAIDVPKLVKGKYQDNLEFLQWIKRYYDIHNTGIEYDPVGRRGGVATKPSGLAPSKPKASTTPTSKAPATTVPAKKAAAVAPVKPTPVAATKAPTGGPARVKVAATTANKGSEEANLKVQELQQQNAELKLTIDGLEKERDFYFSKLREIEVLCQSADQSSESTQGIFRVLYATDDSQEFVSEEATPQEEIPAEEQQEPQEEQEYQDQQQEEDETF